MNNFNPTTDRSKYNDPENLSKVDPIIGIVRVTDIILDPSHPQCEGPEDIGKIFYQLLYKIRKTKNVTYNPKASCAGNNIKVYPVIGECVFLILGPSRHLNDDDSATQVYYLPPFNIWNEINHNAFPDKKDYNDQVNQTPTASEISSQGPNTEPGNFNFGGTQPFVEQSNLNPLQPFAGDVIFEGRWGQSIRFGQTILINNDKFSTKGGSLWPGSGKKNGSPITIFTNNRKRVSGFAHSLEDIDTDGTSIYLTSDQNISVGDIKKSRYPLSSYNTPGTPFISEEAPDKEYHENQAIICSDRIIFNARKDFVLFYGKKGISLSSKKSVHIDAGETVSIDGIDAVELGAGALTKGQKIVLSDNLIKTLSPLIDALNSFASAVSGMSTTPESAIPLMVSSGKKLSDVCIATSNSLEDIKSQKIYSV